MANYHIGNRIMADKERIMSLEGQNAELCDRIAALEQEKMLRDVAEDELVQSKAYELAMRIAREMVEKERSVIREEESVRADREAEERFKEQFAALELRDKAIAYDKQLVHEEAQKLAREKELFENSKSTFEASITSRLKETDEKRRAEFAVRLAQAKDEARAELHAHLGEALARALDKLKAACDSFGTDPVAYEKAISEFVEEASVIESTAVNELTATLREAGSSAIRKDRFLQKLCRTTFGRPSEKKHADDKVSSLLDEFISNPDRNRPTIPIL